MLDDKTKAEIKQILTPMQKPVTIQLFTQMIECGLCKETHELMDELVALTDKLKLERSELGANPISDVNLKIDKVPAMIIRNQEKNYGIRFFGIPAGYEFAAFLSAILLVSNGDIHLTQDTKNFLDNLQKDIHIEVLTAPTCPYCPTMAAQVHNMAFYSDKVTADVIEVSEFPMLIQKYQVEGVPVTIINEAHKFPGAVPEELIVENIRMALGG
jgi:glutaredoxin-like protein